MMSLNSAGWFGRGVNRSFPSSLRLSAQGKRKARRGKGKEEPAVRASVLYSTHQFPYLSDHDNCKYMTNHKYIGALPSMVHTELLYFVYRNEQNKTFLLFWFPKQTRQTMISFV